MHITSLTFFFVLFVASSAVKRHPKATHAPHHPKGAHPDPVHHVKGPHATHQPNAAHPDSHGPLHNIKGLHSAHVPDSICYKKTSHCCWKYFSCGVHVIRKFIKSKCPLKICSKQCYKVCKPKKVLVDTKKCYKHIIFKDNCYRHRWFLRPICVKTPHFVPYCKEYSVPKYIDECRNICHNICKVHLKKCTYYKIFHSHKYCPKLHCSKPVSTGGTGKPEVYTSLKGKFVKKTKAIFTGKH